MISVIIVDDEVLARIGIKSLVSCREDLKVVGTFGLASEALEFMKKNMVDVVITDIEMPEMNGLQFIKEIRENSLANGIIILSCYDNFEYAKEAISFGIDSYVLKCDLNEENLGKELDAVIEKIQHRKKKSIVVEKNEYIENENGVKVVGVIELSPNDSDNNWKNDGKLHEEIVIDLLEEIISKYHMGHLFESYKRSPFIVFELKKETSKEERSVLIENYVDIICQNLYMYTNRKIFISVSEEFYDLQKIPQKYKDAKQAGELVFYYENSGIFWEEKTKWKQDIQELMFSDKTFMEEDGLERFERELDQFLYQCKRELVSVGVVREVLIQAISILIYSVLKNYINDQEILKKWNNKFVCVELIYEVSICSELKKILIQFLGQFRDELKKELNKDGFYDIYHYIDQKLRTGVSIKDMAFFENQSISSFSRKFKEKTQMTPVQYMNLKKIEKVKEYLDKENYTLREIAELTGFSNENYMIRVFKKVTGKTISSYKKGEK